MGEAATAYEYRAFAVGPKLPNLSVSPTNPTVRFNTSFRVTATWRGLDASRPYLGWVEYPDGNGTFLEIN